MGHNINITNDTPSMMYVGETPWHRLGTKLDTPATATEAIQAAGLDFIVEKMALETQLLDIPVSEHFATVRLDTMQVLGVVGKRYVPIQNKDAFCTFDSLVGEGQAIYHTAGALGKGERIWILAKLPDYIRVNGDDIVEKYLLLTNTHDGSSTVSVRLTPIRVVCQNTLNAALRGTEQQVQIRHTNNAISRLNQAHEILGISNKLFTVLGQYYSDMSRKDISTILFKQYIEKVFPIHKDLKISANIRRTHEKLAELYETGRGSEMSKGTLWGAYNAAIEYVDHIRLQSKADSTRIKSMWYGSGEMLKKKAFNSAVEMLN